MGDMLCEDFSVLALIAEDVRAMVVPADSALP